MAIPLFIYAGDLMVRGDIARRLVALASGFVGHFQGGLGQVNTLTSVMFGGVSGCAATDAAAVGGFMMPQMRARGHSVDHAGNITVVPSMITMMMPPSHNMIICPIRVGGKIPIADLIAAGIIPGLVLALSVMEAAHTVAGRRGYPTGPFPGEAMLWAMFPSAVPGLNMILIIFGGVRSGIFTACESSNIAVVYALVVTIPVYRTLTFRGSVNTANGVVKTVATG